MQPGATVTSARLFWVGVLAAGAAAGRGRSSSTTRLPTATPARQRPLLGAAMLPSPTVWGVGLGARIWEKKDRFPPDSPQKRMKSYIFD